MAKAPTFQGRCHGAQLEHAVSQAAHKAYVLRLMTPPAPATLPAGITARSGDTALWLLMLVLVGLAGCKAVHLGREVETAAPTASKASTVAAGRTAFTPYVG